MENIQPNDIHQGELGTCYYLAVLSSLAEVPLRVKSRFITQEVNSAGIFLVTLFINGVITPVIVDDYFPTKSDSPCFAYSQKDELWVMIMEKDWAKVHGSYGRTSAGFAE